MPKVYFVSRYHSCANHVGVKTPNKILARGVPVFSREKSTPSMIKHLKLRISENCLANDHVFKVQIIALEFVLSAKICFND